MRLLGKLLLWASLATSLVGLGFAGDSVPPPRHQDASRWLKEINAFTTADATNPPPRGCIVFTGSSYIRRWTNLVADFPGLPVINRGFGGCELADVLAYADRIILPYAPREVLIYAGGNDIDAGLPAATVFADFADLMTKLHTALPATKLVFISCPPSPKRWSETAEIKGVNALIADYAAHHGITYVDTFSRMLSAVGQPRPDIYVADRLHMNARGYAIWREAVAPVLIP